MRKYIMHCLKIFSLTFCLLLIFNCSDDSNSDDGDKPIEGSDTWDIDIDGIPKFVKTNYIELDKIYRISRFRSSVGHDYSDAFENCRSMKHYFEPKSDLDWSTVRIYCPVNGKITRIDEEWAGTKFEIVSDDYPAFRFSIFHVSRSKDYKTGDAVKSGEELGTHIGDMTMSDIAVMVNDPTGQGIMISYFETITDEMFGTYVSRGIASREELIISKEERDVNPLTCDGDVFISQDILESWIILQ